MAFNTVENTFFIPSQTVDNVCFTEFQTSDAFTFTVSQFLYKATPIAINAVITPTTIKTGALIPPMAPINVGIKPATALKAPVNSPQPLVNIPMIGLIIPITPIKAVNPPAIKVTTVITVCIGCGNA